MSDPGRDPLEDLARWLSNPKQIAAIRKQLTVHEQRTASGGQTTVDVDHQLVCPLKSHGPWRISTKPSMLPRAHFSSQATHLLRGGDPRRGRTLYCHDRTSGEVVAAIGYHVDARTHMPLLITVVALRDDAATRPRLAAQSLGGSFVLKHYVHAISHLLARGGHVDIDLPDRARVLEARRLGFRPAPKVRGFRPGGVHMRQPAPADQSSGSGK